MENLRTFANFDHNQSRRDYQIKERNPSEEATRRLNCLFNVEDTNFILNFNNLEKHISWGN